MSQTEQEWRDNLKAGDEVFISQPYGGIPYVDTVSRVTKTQIAVRVNDHYESMYRKSNGMLVGGDKWIRVHLVMPTEKNLTEVQIHNAKRRIKRFFEANHLPDDMDALKQIAGVLTLHMVSKK